MFCRRHKSNIAQGEAIVGMPDAAAGHYRASGIRGQTGMRVNAGVVVWRLTNRRVQVLLVHQSDKPKTLWSIPKGGVRNSEDYQTAARREVQEETNVKLTDLDILGYVDYGKANKRMYCFMGECPVQVDVKTKMPEIDKAGFFDIGIAKKMVDKRQRGLIRASQKILAFGHVHRASVG
jgi:predicted NUDIX family NTP pyrophosphohydrolase